MKKISIYLALMLVYAFSASASAHHEHYYFHEDGLLLYVVIVSFSLVATILSILFFSNIMNKKIRRKR